MSLVSLLGTSLFCFFHLFSFHLITYYAQYFAQNLPILLSINKILLEYLKLKSTCDCSVKIFHNLATVLLDYLDLFHAICAKFLFFRVYFTKIVPIMPAFCSLLLSLYFSKKIAGKSTCPYSLPRPLFSFILGKGSDQVNSMDW